MTLDKDFAEGRAAEEPAPEETREFKRFFGVRVVAGIVFGVIAIWGVWVLVGLVKGPDKLPMAEAEKAKLAHVDEKSHDVEKALGDKTHGETTHEKTAKTDVHPAPTPSLHGSAPAVPGVRTSPLKPKAKGVEFIEGTIAALDYDLNKRFWGWRRNDILRFTDNVENMQLGVLEVVRRTSITLAERITRYGVTDVIDPNLENAMNWFMVKPSDYWLPSAEEKYKDGLDEFRKFAHKLQAGQARFYTRTDTIIPLLVKFADLLGSADENLVKEKEEDGSLVSWFKIDDYFYYARGVAMAMGHILHGVEEDFSEVLAARYGTDLLENAIHACHVASKLDPWLVTNGALDGIVANHRANMAAPISHARYYLDALAKVLST